MCPVCRGGNYGTSPFAKFSVSWTDSLLNSPCSRPLSALPLSRAIRVHLEWPVELVPLLRRPWRCISESTRGSRDTHPITAILQHSFCAVIGCVVHCFRFTSKILHVASDASGQVLRSMLRCMVRDAFLLHLATSGCVASP